MAEPVFTAGEFEIKSGSVIQQVNAGSTAIEQFDWVYKNGSIYDPADNSTSTKANVAGIAATRCDANGRFILVTSGGFKTTTAVFTQGEHYVLDETPGDMQPDSDKLSSQYITELGRAVSTTEFDMDIDTTGIQKS